MGCVRGGSEVTRRYGKTRLSRFTAFWIDTSVVLFGITAFLFVRQLVAPKPTLSVSLDGT